MTVRATIQKPQSLPFGMYVLLGDGDSFKKLVPNSSHYQHLIWQLPRYKIESAAGEVAASDSFRSWF
jgi:hypothetical protein